MIQNVQNNRLNYKRLQQNHKSIGKYFVLFFSLCFSIFNSQIMVQGTIKNSENGVIPYSAIGIKNTKIGSVSDALGNYKLVIPTEMKNASVFFNAEGYMEKEVKITDLETNGNIILNYKIADIDEVVITSKKFKEKNIGEKKRPLLTFSKMFDKNIPTIEQGTVFRIYEKTIINSYSFHIIPSSKFEQITLKLNIYNVRNGLPVNSLLDENVIYKTSTTGWQTIDLSKYKLMFKNMSEIGITIQLVDYKKLPSDDFVFGFSAKKSLSENLLFRYQSQLDWEKSKGVFISNIDVKYDKKGKSQKTPSIDKENDLTENEEKIVSFYKGREAGLKTQFGKNPSGKFIDLPDGKIYYEEYGKGDPLVLLEGNNGLISDFYNQIPFLSKYFRVIVLDTRNQGKSLDNSTADYGYEKLAEDLKFVLKTLNLNKVNIVGWSDGGITSLIFNYKYPEYVSKVVVIGANTNPSGVKEETLKMVKETFEKSTDKKEKRRSNLLINHPDILAKDLANIKNPVLVIAGDKDDINEKHTRELFAMIKNSQLEIIPNSTHNVPFDQPEILNNLILKFLNK